ncbi:carboxylating nicotinate-nucleotide diphosphorylase [Rhodobacteraceae bacterium]|nr:carboxylating nicotinate-nucleotide diphosphorylase [Paracoccaceae bacterium]
MISNASLPDLVLEPVVRAALMEDLGAYGDITSRAVVPRDLTYRAALNAREAAIVSGMQLARLAFHLVDPTLRVEVVINDGAPCEKGDVLMTITGSATAILSAERVALNFAGHLTGIATKTAGFVARAYGTHARITCTRKTTPGLRAVEKLAVLHGGGANHRFSLSDAVMIKDNHIAAAGGVRAALSAARRNASHMSAVQIEVDTLAQLDEVLSCGGAQVVLFDNMDTATLAQAVRTTDRRLITEASGNVTQDRVAEIAATGVDFISSGALTHSVKGVDLGLDF